MRRLTTKKRFRFRAQYGTCRWNRSLTLPRDLFGANRCKASYNIGRLNTFLRFDVCNRVKFHYFLSSMCIVIIGACVAGARLLKRMSLSIGGTKLHGLCGFVIAFVVLRSSDLYGGLSLAESWNNARLQSLRC